MISCVEMSCEFITCCAFSIESIVFEPVTNRAGNFMLLIDCTRLLLLSYFRGCDIESTVNSVFHFCRQMENGLYIRMAILNDMLSNQMDLGARV